MSIQFDFDEAATFLIEQADQVGLSGLDEGWVEKIETLSRLCEDANVRTHIAFLGTALLAKALNEKIDPRTVKPAHALNKENSYSARTLAEKVLVPVSIQLGVHLGVTGREPLNNQPYFRMKWLGDDTPISSKSKPAFDYMMSIVDQLQNSTSEYAVAGLRAFIAVRKRYAVSYERFSGEVSVSLEDFPEILSEFVAENSENGKRAQAVAAGLLDFAVSPERVVAGRINDPSRKRPGDVSVLSTDGEYFEKAFEVRDKLVKESDVYVFAGICQGYGVGDISIIMVSPHQEELDIFLLSNWAEERGITCHLYYGWRELIRETLYWGSMAMRPGVSAVVSFIEARLREVEISQVGYELWEEKFRSNPTQAD